MNQAKSNERLTPQRLLGPQPVQTLQTDYGLQTYEEYERAYNAYANFCLDAPRKPRKDIDAVTKVAEGLVVLDGNAAYDRFVWPLHNHIFVYCPITAAHEGKWALFEELFRKHAEMAHTKHKIIKAMRLTPEHERLITVVQGLTMRVQNYVYIVTAGGRTFPTPDNEIEGDANLRRSLLDVNECPVCLNQNSKWNSSCKHCSRWICHPCAQKVDKCPMCRSETPDYFRGMDRFPPAQPHKRQRSQA